MMARLGLASDVIMAFKEAPPPVIEVLEIYRQMVNGFDVSPEARDVVYALQSGCLD